MAEPNGLGEGLALLPAAARPRLRSESLKMPNLQKCLRQGWFFHVPFRNLRTFGFFHWKPPGFWPVVIWGNLVPGKVWLPLVFLYRTDCYPCTRAFGARPVFADDQTPNADLWSRRPVVFCCLFLRVGSPSIRLDLHEACVSLETPIKQRSGALLFQFRLLLIMLRALCDSLSSGQV